MMNIDHTFTDSATARWWAAQPDLYDGGTAWKSWLQTVPRSASKADREAIHEAVVRLVVPAHPIAHDLSVMCVLRKEVR